MLVLGTSMGLVVDKQATRPRIALGIQFVGFSIAACLIARGIRAGPNPAE
jgi:hypothetical protein